MKNIKIITNIRKALLTLLFVPLMGYTYEVKSMYVDQVQLIGTSDIANSQQITDLLKNKIGQSNKYLITKESVAVGKKSLASSLADSKVKARYNPEYARELGSRYNVDFVVLGVAEQMGPFIKIKVGLFSVKENEMVVEESEYTSLDIEELKEEVIPGMAMKITGSFKKSRVSEVIKWTALAGVTTFAGYMVAVANTPKNKTTEVKEKNTDLVMQW